MSEVTLVRPKDTPAISSFTDDDIFIVDGAAGVRNFTGAQLKAAIAAAFVAAPTTFKIPELDGTNKIPVSRLPASLSGAAVYKGTSAGNAVPAASGYNNGEYLVITSAGTSQSITWAVADLAVKNGASGGGSWDQVAQGVIAIAQGGTGSTTAAAARTALAVLSREQVQGADADLAGGMYFDGSSGTLALANTTGMAAIGTGDFSIRMRFQCPAAAASAGSGLGGYSINNNQVGNSSVGLDINSSGTLRAIFKTSGGANTILTMQSGFVTAHAGATVDVVLTRSGSTVVAYINGVQTATDTAAGYAEDLLGPYVIVGTRNGTDNFVGTINNFEIFNLALSAADVADISVNGIPYKYQWSNLANLIDGSTLNGGFETAGGGGADVFASWAEAVAGTSTLNDATTAFHGGAHACRMDIDGSNSLAQVSQSLLTMGKCYRVDLWAKSSSGTPDISVGCASGTSGTHYHLVTLSASYAQITKQFEANNASFVIKRSSAASLSLYVDDVVLTRIGCFCQLNFGIGKGTYISDLSGNKLWAEVPTTGTGHRHELRSGERMITKVFNHSDISATAATTKLLDLPKNCALYDVEFDRETAFDAGVTLSIGVTGTPGQDVNAQAVDATGKVWCDGLSKVCKSGSGYTSVWIKKSGATTVGKTTVRVRVVIRGL